MLVVRYIQQLKVPMLNNSANIPCLTTIDQHVHFELFVVSQLTLDLINRLTAYCCVPGNFCGVRIEQAWELGVSLLTTITSW